MTRLAQVVLAAGLCMAPLGTEAADLVIWWNEGYYAEEDEAVREIIAAFEQQSGRQVDLVLHPETELPDKVEAAVEAGEPPDFVFSILIDPPIPSHNVRCSAPRGQKARKT